MKKQIITALFLVLVTLLTAIPLSGCTGDKNESQLITSIEDLNGRRLGNVTGAVFDQIAKKRLPDIKTEYFNSVSDLAVALNANKIDFYIVDDPVARSLVNKYDNQMILGMLEEDKYGTIFTKDSEKSKVLCAQMNEFIAKKRADGSLDQMVEKWISPDAENLSVDYDDLTAENGTLQWCVSTDIGIPLIYIKDGKYAGYEIDVASQFCREYGYGVEFTNTSFTGMIAAVTTGKCHLGSSGISITDERKESMLFSDPSYNGGMAIVVRKSDVAAKSDTYITSVDQLNGKRFGVVTGAIFGAIAEERFSPEKVDYVNAIADLVSALNSNKIDCYITDDPIARFLVGQNSNQTVLATIEEDHYGVIFPKGVEKSTVLCGQMNEFIAKHKADGSLGQMISKWLGPDSDKQIIDYEGLPATNGTLSYAFSSENGAPFAYIQNGKYAGYEVNIAVEFCREYGYGIKFFDTSFAGIISAVSSGKCDFGSSGISITDERKESMLFSDPTYDGGISVVVIKSTDTAETDTSFWASVGESFEKTFIREDRWTMFLSGVGVTMLITVLSVIFGSAIGFALFLIYRKGNKVFVSIVDAAGYILEKLPVVVILMILYYVIFGSLDINNVFVSIIGFTILFSFTVLKLIKVGTGAIDGGQTEAALALGYTDNQAFLKIIFPQAVKHFMPGYKGAVVSLIKDTAIVGYIAVQDLTKISDIVRSRTYEAFFPLIATAIIYFVLAFVLIEIVKSIQTGVDPRRRKSEKILKGVKTK